MLEIELVYAPNAEHQRIYSVSLPKGSTVQQAIETCSVLRDYPEIDFQKNEGGALLYEIGIWYKRVQLGDLLKLGDRLEIYRPLRLSAMEARKARKQEAKALGY